MAGAAQADRAKRDANGSLSRCRQSWRDRPVWGHPDHGAVAWNGGESDSTCATLREIERAITAFARSANGGLIVTGSALANVYRNLIIELAARAKLPAVYSHASSLSPAA